jgi:hypothetical protein
MAWYDVPDPTATAKAAQMREDVTRPIVGIENRTAQEVFDIMADRFRLAHTARPDAGDDKAEIERLRGLLIDPGSPPWEDARAVLVDELRKAGLDCHADNVAAAHGIEIPSHIALNLIAQAARRTDADAGDEDVERVARALCLYEYPDQPAHWHDLSWPDFSDMARAALAAMREGVDRGMVERLEAERSFLIERAGFAGSVRFGGERSTGASSNAIVAVAFGQPDRGDMPYDSDDLAACYRALMKLPAHLLTDAVGERLAAAEAFAEENRAGTIEFARTRTDWPGFAALSPEKPR